MATGTLDQTADRIVRQEVYACVSALVHQLAGFEQRGKCKDADDLIEQALELAAPIPDYEAAAIDAGYQVRHDLHGFYVCSDEEAEGEDAGSPSAGFDGRKHLETIDDGWRKACEMADVEPYDRDVYEHWIVSDWFAEKLEAHGEKVDKDFAGLTVWARTTTGQSISMDSVIQAIAKELA